jgi:hypothetical protein
VLENVSTKAGALKLVKIVDYDIGETNWRIVLRGKSLYRTQDDVFGSVTFHTVFKANQDRETILMQESTIRASVKTENKVHAQSLPSDKITSLQNRVALLVCASQIAK